MFSPQQALPGGSNAARQGTTPIGTDGGPAAPSTGAAGATSSGTTPSGAAAPGSAKGLHPAQRDQDQQAQDAGKKQQSEQQKENEPNPQLGSGGTPGSESAGGGSAGQGSKAGGSVLALSDEQKEKVRRVIRSYSIAPPERAKFPLRLGATVPSDVQLRPLPPEVASVVPDYRNFSYVVAGGQIAIVITEKREIDLLIPT